MLCPRVDKNKERRNGNGWSRRQQPERVSKIIKSDEGPKAAKTGGGARSVRQWHDRNNIPAPEVDRGTFYIICLFFCFFRLELWEKLKEVGGGACTGGSREYGGTRQEGKAPSEKTKYGERERGRGACGGGEDTRRHVNNEMLGSSWSGGPISSLPCRSRLLIPIQEGSSKLPTRFAFPQSNLLF